MSDAASTRTAPDADLSGRRLGDFQILRRLGRGGMADVYLAEQSSLGRQVAVKVLKTTLASDDNYVKRFRNEANAVARLSHANIVQIYDILCIDGIHFIAQEYVKGQNLRQLLSRQGSIDGKLALHVLRQVAAALHRAGQQNIIHRDIKPENIMLAATGEVKVTDFGLARVVQNGELNLTQIGVTMGTPLYMSPEQVEGKAIDQRSDLYSLGVTLYHMLAGRTPFSGETPLSIAVQHLKTEPDPLHELRPDVPPGLCRIVHKLMAKLPEQRYANAAELLRELRTLQSATGNDDWSSESLAAIDLELAGHEFAPIEATQQLQAVMQKTATIALRAQKRWWHWIPISLAIGAVAGGAAAWATRPEPLLTTSAGSGEPRIAKRGSVEEQYYYALTANPQSEAAYVAVWDHFPASASPQNMYYSRRAKQRLAKFYRDDGQKEKAIALYRELVDVGTADPIFPVIGHIGLANIYHADGDMEKSQVQLDSALAIKLPPERQAELGQMLDEPLREQWRQRLRQTTP